MQEPILKKINESVTYKRQKKNLPQDRVRQI